jgi:AraC-like DNA-binding protein
MNDSPLSSAFRRSAGPEPKRRVLALQHLVVSEFLSEEKDLVISGTVPRDEAYVVTLHLRARPRGAMCAEGRWIDPTNFAPGNAGIVDLRTKLTSEYAGPFHYMSLYVPRTSLDQICDDAGSPRVGDLRHRPAVGFSDPVLRHLLLSLRPVLAIQHRPSVGYADHVALALVSHLAATYGGMRTPGPPRRGGLTPHQERRAKEWLDARVDGRVSLAELARACELSVRHFSRAFRESTGQAPYAWLLERRLERARGLLELTSLTLRDVATRSGFANQSHFTRAFTRAYGLPPGAFRRAR